MSVARVLWKKEGKEEAVIATRWNGSGERPLGNPSNLEVMPPGLWSTSNAADSVAQAARAAAERSPS